MKQLFALCFVIFALNACAPAPPLNFSVPNVGPSSSKLDAEVKSITVSVARPDEKTGDINAATTGTTPFWQSSIEEALNKMAIFKDDSPRKISIAVKILKFDLTNGGLLSSNTSHVAARYDIIDRSNGSVIFTTDIDTDGGVEATDNAGAFGRAREAMNRAVQNNILQFLEQLETVNLNKPMFPAKADSK